MAKLKVEANRDTELVKFEALQIGEVFITTTGRTCMKMNGPLDGINAAWLDNGCWLGVEDDALVTYVKSAELKLTI